jgi:hypothetical protein
MSRSTRKACDACSVRKVQCDGGQPCRRCVAYSFKCTFLKSRGKPGPKGPHKRTAEAIGTLQSKPSTSKQQQQASPNEKWASSEGLNDTENLLFDNFNTHDGSPHGSAVWTRGYAGSSSLDPIQPSVHSRIDTSCIAHHLNKYEFRAYSIWPIIDAKSLISQILADPEDMEAYGLATALCATLITQFDASSATSQVADGSSVSHGLFETESRRARLIYDHRERMTIRSLLTSFFLHVYAANIGKKTTATLLLNEAVTMAHIIGLHKRSYYDNLDENQQQYCLRVYWLLFISERCLPLTLRLPRHVLTRFKSPFLPTRNPHQPPPPHLPPSPPPPARRLYLRKFHPPLHPLQQSRRSRKC